MRFNPILMTDSYKASHWLQYPPGTTGMYDYMESRGGKFGSTIFFGLQYLIKEYLTVPITDADVVEAKEVFEAHGEPFNAEGFGKIVANGGHWPIRIKAVPEGMEVPTRNIVMSLESTGGADTFWSASWVEAMHVRNWYPCTVATQSYYCKRIILEHLLETANDPWSEIYFKLHDFGARGVSSHESAGIGGMSHLVNFRGTDTLEGIMFARAYYGEPMAGYSIPAAEHSSITSWGRERELLAYRNMINQFLKKDKVVACVSDSFDIFNVIENMWCGELLDQVKNSGGCLVIRPDSGDPPAMVLRCLQTLENKLGMVKNMRGYKVLPPYFKLIQGDGINIDSLREILTTITAHKYSTSNLAFGMGGGLLQMLDRDTQKWALKCSEITTDAGTTVPVFKDPITDPGKVSKSGRLSLIMANGEFKSVPAESTKSDMLETVFENGKLLREQTFTSVRANSEKNLSRV
jgi:nicotinamide phosphoribosyltransferase